jgi:hypothetical protein
MRWLVLVLALGSIAPAQASSAQTQTVSHYAPVPCASACPHWDVSSWKDRVCNGPQIPGSYDQTYFDWESENGVANFKLDPLMDYDFFACTDTEPSQLVTWGGIPLWPPCDGLGYPYIEIFGCEDQMSIPQFAVLHATGGETDRFFIRSFNFSDIASVDIIFDGPVIVTDDSFAWPGFATPGR